MAIKDKNGNFYKLKGPNPIMSTQQIWDSNKLSLHNMVFPQIILPDYKRNVGQIMIEPDLEPVPIPSEDQIPLQQSVPINEKPTQENDSTLEKLNQKRIPIYCLPCRTNKHTDDFYGSTYTKEYYGEKTTIPGFVVNEEDLSFIFWTDQEVPVRSVIFPSKNEMKRWWRVESSVAQSLGFLVTCYPSDFSPSFEE